ncbi:MAG: NACHT domain-containing protein, partial [Acidobacteria bacterium]|nr:NACHT domain-containing protein [Acidobacteriota bacterium]
FKIPQKREKKEFGEDFVNVFENQLNKQDIKTEPLKMVLLGHPGSGKTTLLKWIAIQCTHSANPIFSSYIPVYIPLNEFEDDPDRTYRFKNIYNLSIDMLNREGTPSSFLEEFFFNNRIIFLLDGLDGIGNELIRKEIIQWIENQNIRENILLSTSRFSGLQEAKGLNFRDVIPQYEIMDLDITDIEHFLRKWYRHIEIAVSDNDDNKNKVFQRSKKNYEDLINIIKSNQKLYKLAVNPLLLTIIAIVYCTRAVLPTERHKLYDECLKVMIELWNVANRKINVNFSVENSMANLSRIAAFLMEENCREITWPCIMELLPGIIEEKSLDFFLKEMTLKTGLLYESEGKYGFVYLTFQDYLAAWYYTRRINQNEILAFRDNEHWTETFKLFVNIGSSELFFAEIIKNLFEKEYWTSIKLWTDCLKELVNNENRNEITKKLYERILNFFPEEITYRWGDLKEMELLEYLSNLSKSELKFILSENPLSIAKQISQAILPFNIRSIENLLDFKTDFQDQSKNLLYIKAFLMLKKLDFEKIRNILVEIIYRNPNPRTRLNALYIFKKIN